jgi:hypothetical protein
MKYGKMPKIPFGSFTVSRLIVGGNPINGTSHLSRFVDLQMRRYFKPDIVLKFLNHCTEVGIDTWQSSSINLDLYLRHKKEGGNLQFISLATDDPEDPHLIKRLVNAGVIAIAHHGEVTDQLFKEGKIDKIKIFLEKVHNAGVMVGISTHMPTVIEYIEKEGWDIDFYMTCIYERNLSRGMLKSKLKKTPIPYGEIYLEEDPPHMFNAIKSTTRTCLAFKILAAGRLCERQEMVEQSFKSTFQMIKSNDAVIVGMYPEYEDQAFLNSQYVSRFNKLSYTSP